MMKSPSEQADPTNINSMNQMNPGRRMSWQGQYQMNQAPPPQHHQSSDGQPPGPPQFYPEKMDMYPAPSSFPPSTVANTGVDQWQSPSTPGVGAAPYAHSEPSPAQANSHFAGEHREANAGVNSNGMSGAAAAAAAAMAAAAHTAKGSPGYQKPASISPLLNAVHKPSPMPPVQRASPFHPNYANVQSGVQPQNAAPPPGDPTVPNHSYPPSQPPQPMNRPPNPAQYGQWASPQPNSMEHRPSPGFQHGFESQPIPGPERVLPYASDSISRPMSNASSHDSEESRTKTISARSTSQKLSALYEPDEPGRKEFIDSVLHYWEEKDLPLKHAPMMGGRTLDMFNLYQQVRNRGFMQEVSRSKKWTEISNAMGLGNTSASGFTLKKQYCKYLFGFECRTERQEPEPQEALGRVLEANRKKKQLADQSHAKATDNSHYGEIPPPNMMHHPHSMPRPPQHHPGPMGYHHQQMPGYHHGYPGHGRSVHNPMAGPYEQQSYGGPVNSGGYPHYPPNRPMSQPRYPYRPNGIPPPTHPQAGPQVYPNIQNRGRSPSQPPFNQPYMNQMPPAPHHDMPPEMPPIVRNMTPKPLSNMPESHPASPAVKNVLLENTPSDGGMSGSMSQSMAGFQSPASSITATADDGNSNMSDTPSVRPKTATPQPYGPMPPGKPNDMAPTPITNALNHALPGGRSNTPKVSDAMNSPMPHVPRPDFSKGSHMRRGSDMNSIKMNDPGLRPPGPQYYPGSSSVGQEGGYMSSGPYLPPARGPERPPGPGMYQTPQHSYHQTYSPYRGNSQMNVMRQYGQKRMPSMDNFGPPSKMPRPYNAEQQRIRGYPPPPRPEINTAHNYHPPYSQPAHPMRPYHPPGQHPSIQQHQRHHLPMPRNESPATRPHTPDPHKSRTHIAHPPESASNFLKGLVSCPPMRPITGYYHPGSHFPQGSVESVMPVGAKIKEKSGHDVGVIEAWQIIMSLKSGLHSESIWALNALTILLHDNRTVRQIILTQLPGLLNIIIEHYRFCLFELFGYPKLEATEGRKDVVSEDSHSDAENLAAAMAMKCMSSSSTLNIRDKQVKYSTAPTKLQSPYCKLPVKMVAGDDKFPLLLDTLWKNPQKPAMSEFLPISGFKSKANEANVDETKDIFSKIRPQMDCNAERMEMTFEDMLSVPSFMKSNEQEKASRTKAEDVKEGADDKECKAEGGSNKVAANIRKPANDSPTFATANASGSTSSHSSDHKESSSSASHIQSCLDRFAWDCDVALLEEEATGFPGNIGFRAPSGGNSWHIAIRGLEYVFPKRPVGKDPELVVRVLCLSNILRSVSCAFANHYDLSMHQIFFSSLCGTLLLGHKHRLRCTKFSKHGGIEFQYNNEESDCRVDVDKLSVRYTSSALSTQNHPVNANEITKNCPDSKTVSFSDVKSETDASKSEMNNNDEVVKKEFETEIKNPDIKKEPEEASTFTESDVSCEQRTFTTIEHIDRDHHESWWWDCARQLREDSLVILANLSASLDLSVLPSEGSALAILDACLHWCVCPSADAQDPSPAHSAQSLGIEILTKLSMKENNVDLILATKPYSRLEKLLKTLTIMSGNRQNPVLREFSMVLLCNLCGDESCARAVALQAGAISNFLSFLEECEETGLRHQRVFTAGQERINCGTVSYMMQKCVLILLKLARLEENRPLFLKHQLRLVSLSMSGLLGGDVLPLLSAVLFELSRVPPNR